MHKNKDFKKTMYYFLKENKDVSIYLSIHQIIVSDDEDEEIQVTREIEIIDLPTDEENEGINLINDGEIEVICLTRDDDQPSHQPQPMMQVIPNFLWEITITYPQYH